MGRKYRTLGECSLKDFVGCEINFERVSGRQLICKTEHFDKCLKCGGTFNILSFYGKKNIKYSEYKKGAMLCLQCFEEKNKNNRSSGAKIRSFKSKKCILSTKFLLEGSNCETDFTPKSSQSKICYGSHLVYCPNCNNNIINITVKNMKKYLNGQLQCKECSTSNRTHNVYCTDCKKSTNHSSKMNQCLNCLQKNLTFSDYCNNCKKIRSFKGNSCFSCSTSKSYFIKICLECGQERKHNMEECCISCSSKRNVSIQFCSICSIESTFWMGKCCSCRNKKIQSTSNCQFHGETLFQGGNCCKCQAHRGYITRLNNYKNNSSVFKRGFQSKIEFSFIEEFRKNNIYFTPEYVNGYQVDGISSNNRIIFEFDGWYYHRNVVEKDLVKSKIFLDSGYILVRVRECESSRNHILPLLDLDDVNFLQYSFDYSEKNITISNLVKIIWNDLNILGVL